MPIFSKIRQKWAENDKNKLENMFLRKVSEVIVVPGQCFRCSTPTPESSVVNGTITRRQRISAYDNVERGATSSLLCPDSAQSDDGTVFSEPWDSSQWDSFLPQDGKNKMSSDLLEFQKQFFCLSRRL